MAPHDSFASSGPITAQTPYPTYGIQHLGEVLRWRSNGLAGVQQLQIDGDDGFEARPTVFRALLLGLDCRAVVVSG